MRRLVRPRNNNYGVTTNDQLSGQNDPDRNQLNFSSMRGDTYGHESSENASINSVNRDRRLVAPSMETYSKCMVVCQDNSQIAFALYDEEKNEMVLEHNHFHVHEKDSHRIVEAFIDATNPNLILVGGKTASNSSLMDLLTNRELIGEENDDCEENSNSNNGTSIHISERSSKIKIEYKLLKSNAFDLKNSKQLILNRLRVLTILQQFDEQNLPIHCFDEHDRRSSYDTSSCTYVTMAPSRYHSLASLIDFDCRTLVRAVGALISYLQTSIFRLEEGSTVTINSIRQANSSHFMRISNQTLKSLHIFSTEYHPLLANTRGKSKEGFSIFTLLDRTMSKAGRKCLREWMIRPLLDPVEINKRYDTIDLFLKPEMHATVTAILNFLKRVGTIDKVLLRMKKCISTPMDFITLSNSLSAAISIHSALQSEVKGIPMETSQVYIDNTCNMSKDSLIIEEILSKCNGPGLEKIQKKLLTIIDIENTMAIKDSVVIQRGCHEELDIAKDEFEKLDGMTFKFLYFFI